MINVGKIALNTYGVKRVNEDKYQIKKNENIAVTVEKSIWFIFCLKKAKGIFSKYSF